MKKLEFIKKTILPVLLSVTMISSTSLADGTNRQSQISSHGAVDITSGDGSVLIDSEDMKTLANETDTLESIYKTRLQQAVNRLNTFIQPDGSITHKKEASGNQMTLPSFDLLASAITNSQSSSTAIADLSGTNYYKTNEGKINTSGSGTSVSLGAASADNLSAGKIAFVDGTLLLGTGSDNESYFNQGYTAGTTDGQAKKTDNVSVQYHYHVHIGSADISSIPDGYVYYSNNDPGGCFEGRGHVHNKVVNCRYHLQTCGGTLTYHHHDSCVDSGSGWGTDNGHVSCGWVCDKCHDWPKNSSGGTCQKTSKVYDCHSPTNKWVVSCGMTTGTLESITIAYQ